MKTVTSALLNSCCNYAYGILVSWLVSCIVPCLFTGVFTFLLSCVIISSPRQKSSPIFHGYVNIMHVLYFFCAFQVVLISLVADLGFIQYAVRNAHACCIKL